MSKEKDQEIDYDLELEKTVNSIGWGIFKERIIKKIKEETDLESINLNQDSIELKAEAKGMKLARKIAEKVFSEVEGEVNYTKKKKTNYG